MSANEVSLVLKHVKKFPNSVLNLLSSKEPQDAIGGIIKKGQLGWIASGSHLEVVSLKTGNRVASYTFDNAAQISNTVITCLTEIEFPVSNSCILAIGVQFQQTGGMICIFAIQGSRILRCIEVKEKITSCCFVPETICQRSIFKLFDGCLAIGSENGNILMIDLCFKKCSDILFGRMINRCELELIESRIFLANTNFKTVRQEYKSLKKDGFNIGMQLDHLEEIEIQCSVLSILVLSPLMSLTFGLSDGRMLLYNLMDLQPYHLAHPPEMNSPLIKLAYLEPADDPRACVYIWALHGSSRGSIAVMHSVMFEKKIIDENFILYDNFQACTVRCTMPFFDCDSQPISCQAITKKSSNEEYDICLMQFGWGSTKNDSNIIIFDLNQWYKEQMPNISDWRSRPSYLVSFQLNTGLCHDIWIDEKTVDPFNSIQRPEEHFYPNSLSFDCLVLSTESCILKHWPGLQNKVLDLLESSGPNAILQPDRYINEVISAALMPQFGDYNFGTNFTLNSKRDFLLSIALEYNSVGLLKECAKVWADGSHLGQQPFEGLSLSTLTEWIWKQANDIKECCKTMSQPLFDNSRTHIDNRSKKTLSHCARQLQLLSDLLEMVLISCKINIPLDIYKKLISQQKNIKMLSEYQEVLQWLLNIGLIPEFEWKSFGETNDEVDVYQDLRYDYMEKRNIYFKADKSNVDPTSCSCKILYIDSFIEHECGGEALRKLWKDGWNDGLYPPRSLESMLKVMLLPEVCIENKYMLLVYFFLDLNYMAQCDERFSDVVKNLIKFPAVFKLNPALIKTTQAFWNLDRERFEVALEELISPLSQNRQLSKWQQEFLIESLIAQNVPNFALRALRALGSHIPPQIEMKTFLANNLIAEALQLQRSKGDNNLLRDFFKYCFTHEKWKYLFNLALSEDEDTILTELLNSSDLILAENFQFLYLLQRSKYIEAISHVNNLHKRSDGYQRDFANKALLLSAYDSTVTPLIGNLSGFYLRFHDKFKNTKQKSFTKPLSSKLIQDRTNIVGGIYQRAFMSTEAASWDDEPQPRNDVLSKNDIPFLRKPILDRYTKPVQKSQVIFPKLIDSTTKRNSEIRLSNEMEGEGPRKRVKLDNESSLLSRKSIHDLNSSNLTSFKAKSHRDVMEFLDKTLEGRNKRDDKMSTPIQGKKPEQLQTPQSILKITNIFKDVSATTVTTRRSCSPFLVSARKSVEPDEKSIRFNLPESQNSSIDSARKSPSFLGATIRDSIRSTDNSIVSSSVDEFFSPIGSENTSAVVAEVVEQPPEIKIIITPPKEDIERSVPSTRRGLREKSKSPEPSTSKDPRFSYKMPLSRLVLESNAKKIIETSSISYFDESMEADSSFNDSDVDAILLQREKILSENTADSESLLRKWNATMETTSTSEASPLPVSILQSTNADESSIQIEEIESDESSDQSSDSDDDDDDDEDDDNDDDDDDDGEGREASEKEEKVVQEIDEYDLDSIEAERQANEAEIQANEAVILAIEAEIHAREILIDRINNDSDDSNDDNEDEIEDIENEIEDIVGEIRDMEDEMDDTDDDERRDSDYASNGSDQPSPEIIEIGSSDESSSSIFSHSSFSLDVPEIGDENSNSSVSTEEEEEEEEIEVILSEAEDEQLEVDIEVPKTPEIETFDDSKNVSDLLYSNMELPASSSNNLNIALVNDSSSEFSESSLNNTSVSDLNKAVILDQTTVQNVTENILDGSELNRAVWMRNTPSTSAASFSQNIFNAPIEILDESVRIINSTTLENVVSSTNESQEISEEFISDSMNIETIEDVEVIKNSDEVTSSSTSEEIVEIKEPVVQIPDSEEILVPEISEGRVLLIEEEVINVTTDSDEILVPEMPEVRVLLIEEEEVINVTTEKEEVITENIEEIFEVVKEEVENAIDVMEAENLIIEKEEVIEKAADIVIVEQEAEVHRIEIEKKASEANCKKNLLMEAKETVLVESEAKMEIEAEISLEKEIFVENLDLTLVLKDSKKLEQKVEEEPVASTSKQSELSKTTQIDQGNYEDDIRLQISESDSDNEKEIFEAPSRVLRKTRARSIDIRPTISESPLINNSIRATSMTKLNLISNDDTPPTTPSRRSKRTASTETPTRVLRGRIALDKIEEDENFEKTPITPKRNKKTSISEEVDSVELSPRRLRSNSISENVTPIIPHTPTRRTRKNSEISLASEEPSTSKQASDLPKPRGRKRSTSVNEGEEKSSPSGDFDDSKSDKSSVRSSRRLRSQQPMEPTIPEEEDPEGSIKSSASGTTRLGMKTRSDSGASTPKRGRTPISSQEVSPAEAIDYSSSRRLTRHQLAAMEKAAKKIEAHKNLPQKRMPMAEERKDEEDESDAESVVSNVSKLSKVSSASKARSVRSNRKKSEPEKEIDTVSVASSGKRGRPKKITTPPTTNLAMIEEDSESDNSVSEEPTKKRGRPKKNKN